MGITHREIISIIQLIVYFPVLLASGIVVFRHGRRRDLGWVYLTTFSLVRIVGAIMLIVSETESNPSSGLVVAAFVIQSAGLSPLMLATAGFLGVVSQGADLAANRYPIKKIFHVALIVALILAIVAGTDSTDSSKTSEVNTLRRVSSIIFLCVYVAFIGIHVYYWRERRHIPLHRRTLLLAISCALPFLGARLIFSLGSSFSSLTNSKFSLVSGSPVLYGFLAVLPEFLVVLTYTIAGILLPLDEDPMEGRQEEIESGGPKQYHAPQQQQYNAPQQRNQNPYAPTHHYPPQGR